MKTALTFLISVGLVVLFQQSNLVVPLRPGWRGYFILSQDACEARCKLKHGLFQGADGWFHVTAHGKVYKFIAKCQCHTSPELKKLITEKFGRTTALKFSALSAVGLTGRARRMLEQMSKKLNIDDILFISADSLDPSSMLSSVKEELAEMVQR